MPKRFFLPMLVFAAAAAAVGGACSAEPPEVGVIVIKPGAIELTTQLNGRAAARVAAEVRPQVNGIIKERLFEEGTDVKSGQQLYQIDPSMFAAELKSSEATLDKAKANQGVTEAKKKRYDELLKQKAVSQQDWDEVNAANLQAQAEIGIADAEVAIARINVDYTKVFAPISGRIGKSGVTRGALVTANQSEPLATIQQIDPIYVDVSQSTAGLFQVRRALGSGLLKQPEKVDVRLVLEDGTDYPHAGRILFADLTVDQGTGSISLRSEFPNPDWDLLPGMYVKAVIRIADMPNGISIPQQSLQRNSDGSAFVYVVGSDGTVEKRDVVVYSALKNQWLIESGLAEGDRIVVDGLQRIRFIPGQAAPVVRAVDANGGK